ncbi:molybdate ABC transporter substrate-binding protein [Luteococcus sediminum]
MPIPRPVTAGAAALVAAGALGGCSPLGGAEAPASPAASTGQRTITVFAAASLKESFSELGRIFEQQHPGSTVQFSFGGSSTLAAQIGQGAPADVFAAASPATMRIAEHAGAVGSPVTFARNEMQVVVAAGNPGRVTRLDDLARPGLDVALCDVQVPCGAASQQVLQADHLSVSPSSWEPDVKAVLTRVALGEADAGIVYVTDVRAAGESVRGIEIPDGRNARTSYPIATLRSSRQLATAQAFVDLVLSEQGQKVLAADGFLP